MWFTERDASKIGRVTPAGAFTEFPIPTAASKPNGIIAGADGNLWFAETAGDQIGRVTPSGTFTEFPIPTAASKPMGISLGADGNVWFTEYAVSKIGRITPAGTITEFGTLFANDGPLYITPGRQSDGAVWYSASLGGHVGFQSLTGGTAGETTVPVPPGSGAGTPPASPSGIVTGSDGALHFPAYAFDGATSGQTDPYLGRLLNLFAPITTQDTSFTPNSQALADSQGGIWFVIGTSRLSLVRQTPDRGTGTPVFNDVALTPSTSGSNPCVTPIATLIADPRACPLAGVAFGAGTRQVPDQAVYFTDYRNNAIGRFPTAYAGQTLPGPAGATGPQGPAGPAGASGTTLPPGAAGPPPVGALGCGNGAVKQDRTGGKSVRVTFTCNQRASLRLSGTATPPRAKAKKARGKQRRKRPAKPKPIAIRALSGSATAGRPFVFTIALPGKAGAALRNGNRVALTLTLTATNAQGRTSKIKLNTSVKGKAKRKQMSRH